MDKFWLKENEQEQKTEAFGDLTSRSMSCTENFVMNSTWE